MSARQTTIALVGNPNCGKTTIFNALTGRDQRVGNWPGVTVERKEGRVKLTNEPVTIVDLPGIYALLASSEDEQVARDYILSGEPALVVDIVDATNLERNLFLTTQLLDMGVPLVVLVNMMDLAEARGITVDVEGLQKKLGCPVIGISATEKRDTKKVVDLLARSWRSREVPTARAEQAEEIEHQAAAWHERLRDEASVLGANSRWVALKLLERDPWVIEQVTTSEAMAAPEIEEATVALEQQLGDSLDIVLAEARYDFIGAVTEGSVTRSATTETKSDRADRIVLNRWLGIPIFLLAMYALFWFSVNLGGAFIDFFDIAGGAIFVDGFGAVLGAIGAPDWLILILANGVGAGIQTMGTFVPPIFVMFLGLSLLEDSGYMARAAFVMDRFMRWVGLPGKSFVPMLLGFGCNVPAIMATRTLENKRDRYMTVFMNPFMSCGARLPIYVLFGAAFFGASAGLMTFSLYLVGIAVAILTGLLLKNTLFKGEASYFVMELPPYHRPRAGSILRYSWQRLYTFLTRAKYIIPLILILAVLNATGTDFTLGHEDTPNSLLSKVGQSITPVFEPMGVEKENWPATVGVFTGLLAKETVVTTLNSLYSQEAAAAGGAEEEAFSLGGALKESLATIPANLAGAIPSLIDPLGVTAITGEKETAAEEVGASSTIYAGLQSGFTHGAPQAYAYLLFMLLYLPCIPALAAMTKEIGVRYTLLALAYLAVIAWSIATLFFQLTVAHNPLWIIVAVALICLMALVFWVIGRRHRSFNEHAVPATTGASL